MDAPEEGASDHKDGADLHAEESTGQGQDTTGDDSAKGDGFAGHVEAEPEVAGPGASETADSAESNDRSAAPTEAVPSASCEDEAAEVEEPKTVAEAVEAAEAEDAAERRASSASESRERCSTCSTAGPDGQNGDAMWHRHVWRPRYNKYPEETDADPQWYQHKRHLLIFTYSGKPVYSRYGCEDGLSGTTGAMSAIVAKVQGFFFSNHAAGSAAHDSLRYMVAGDHMFVFVERGPLWLVCISKCGDTYRDLVRLLDRVYLQVITILTTGVETTLQQRPNWDMRSLLGGTDTVVNNVIRWCTQDLQLQLEGFEPLPLSPTYRQIALGAIRAAGIQNMLLGFIMAGHRIVSIITNRQYRPHALDLCLLINLIMSSPSLRTAESWTPVCLPHFNDKAFAYAYISFVEESDVGVVFLSTDMAGEQFYAISQQASSIKKTLKSSGCLDAVNTSVQQCPIDLRRSGTEDGRPSTVDKSAAKKAVLSPVPSSQSRLLEGIIHAAYFIPQLQQVFSSEVATTYRSRRRSKMLFRAYGRCRELLRTAKLPSQICIATDHECFYVSISQECHIYLAVPRGISTGVIGQFYQWVRSQEQNLFLGSLPTW